MRLARWLMAGVVMACCASPVLAQGIDRQSAAARPNEAGALPESESIMTYEAQPSDTASPSEFPAGIASERLYLPATASPLAVLAVSGLMALAAGGGLYRLRRES